MSNFSIDPAMIRVDFFKPSGKWYTTEAIRWTGSWESGSVIDEFSKSLHDHLGQRMSEMTAVCLEPYSKFSFPLMIKDGGWNLK